MVSFIRFRRFSLSFILLIINCNFFPYHVHVCIILRFVFVEIHEFFKIFKLKDHRIQLVIDQVVCLDIKRLDIIVEQYFESY